MRKQFLLFSILLVISLQGTIQAQYWGRPYFLNYKRLDVNNITPDFDNYGHAMDYPSDNVFHWNTYRGEKGIVFDQGFGVIGKMNGKIAAGHVQWQSTFTPGPIINGNPAVALNSPDSVRYRVYKISTGDNETNNTDYKEWPFDLGAPKDKYGKPQLLGNQTLYTIYNGLDSTIQKSVYHLNPLMLIPVEIHQTVFARAGHSSDSTDIFSNVIFMQYSIVNKSNVQIDSAYIDFWSDMDFYGDDHIMKNSPQVDTVRQTGYCWGELNFPNVPAVGYTMLYGPSVPSTGSSAVFKGKVKQNYKNLRLSSFHPISDDSSVDPLTGALYYLPEFWNAARGLGVDGKPIYDPTSDVRTVFPFSGDPVTGTGWLSNCGGSGGAGMTMFSGPFTLAPNDTQWVMIALVPGLGRTGIESIQIMRKKAEYLRSMPYDSLAFGTTKKGVVATAMNEPTAQVREFSLKQNYPNPFNPATTISYSIPERSQVELKIFDMLGREVSVLVNKEQNAGEYKVQFDASNLPSGIYIYRLQSGSFSQTKKLILLK
ncbi:MAG: T9SS type A sorting domain-containing protein [Methanococcaceae archaeon]